MNVHHDAVISRRHMSQEHGLAVLLALMMLALFLALGFTIVLTTTSETKLSSNFGASGEGLYAADAALEKVMDDLLSITNWNQVFPQQGKVTGVDPTEGAWTSTTYMEGEQKSGFIDGP